MRMTSDVDDLSEWVTVRYSPQGAAAAVADGSIVNRPAFDVDDADEMLDRNATEDDVFLALAKHVPAVSGAMGGTNVVLGARIENHDLNSKNEYRNGWGRNDEFVYKQKWLHSDMKDMAYFYVFKLYDQLTQKGVLK